MKLIKNLERISIYVKRFLGFSFKEQLLCIKILCLAGFFRLVILVVPFKKIAQNLSKTIKVSNYKDNQQMIYRIGQIIGSVCRHTPWDSKCLVQALICKTICRQHKVVNTLYLGVNRDNVGQLLAHAWVTDADKRILVGGKFSKSFKIIATYSDVDLNEGLN